MTRSIVIASGKGGTGKTTIAINLALSLHNFGKEVILLDTNLTTPHMNAYLGFPNNLTGIHDVLKGEKKAKDAIYLHASGLKVIPSVSNYNTKIDYAKEISSIVIELYGKSELVIMDSAATLGSETISAIEAADETIVVTNPELSSVMDALKSIKIAEDSGSVVVGAIVNKAGMTKEELSQDEIKNILGTTMLGVVPYDKNVMKSIVLKQPLLYTYPRSSASREFRRIAELIK